MFEKLDLKGYGNFPVRSMDIDHKHLFELAKYVERSSIVCTDTISLSCYIHAARKGNERAVTYLERRYRCEL